MAVAEKPKTQTPTTANPVQRLALASFVGAVYVLFCLGVLFPGLPLLWESLIGSALNAYLSTSLLLMVWVCVFVGLMYAGHWLQGSEPLPGVRAGSAVGALSMFVGLLITLTIVNMLAPQELGAAVTWAAAGGIGGALVVGVALLFFQPWFSNWLVGLDKQGWFSAEGYKPTQGVRVRRGTLMGLLVIVGFGIYTAAGSHLFEAFLGVTDNDPRRPWGYPLPNTGAVGSEDWLYLLFQVPYTAPLLAFAVLGWFSWRIVNYPGFADFLIATEAEMNKVSWTTKRRLVQDTIVVLVTVVLLTSFLFIVDILWIEILKIPRVLQIDTRRAVQEQRQSSQW